MIIRTIVKIKVPGKSADHILVDNATCTTARRNDVYQFESKKFDEGEIINFSWCSDG